MKARANSRAGRPFALDVLANSVVFLFCRVALARFANDLVVDLKTNSDVSPLWRALLPARRWLHFAMDALAILLILLPLCLSSLYTPSRFSWMPLLLC